MTLRGSKSDDSLCVNPCSSGIHKEPAMRMRLFAAATAAALAILAVPSAADANHSWGGYHWARTSNPFTILLGDDVSSTWDSYLSVASSDWTASSVLNTSIYTASGSPSSCSATSGRVKVCNASYGSTGWLGVASISISGLHITSGTVKLNDTYFNTSTYNTPAWRQLVTCQEVGHTFGLDHQDTNFNNPNLNTCMDYTNLPASNQHPNAHDYAELVTIYTHLDSTSTVGTAVPTALSARRLNALGNTAASWGTRIAGSQAEGASTYVRQFAGGGAVITHVLWA
jgi:hypothetical protein